MKVDKRYIIPFSGLKEGKHQFTYKIDDTFFESYPYDDILGSDVLVTLEFVKKSTLLELFFEAKGVVKVACDVTNELFDLPIENSLKIIVKFGDFYNDENEEILIIPHSEHELDVSQFIYEMLVLALPAKKEHPGIEDGTLKSEILDKLKELDPTNKKVNNDTDPRWSKLKDLLTDN